MRNIFQFLVIVVFMFGCDNKKTDVNTSTNSTNNEKLTDSSKNQDANQASQTKTPLNSTTPESEEMDETKKFNKEFPFYSEISCGGFQIKGCVYNVLLRNGSYVKKYEFNDLYSINGTNDGNIKINDDFKLIEIDLRNSYDLTVQNPADYPILNVKVFKRGLDGSKQVIFEQSTSKKYELINVRN